MADPEACLTYQKQQFVAGDGTEALLELSANAAKALHVAVPREKYMEIRASRIAELLKAHGPEIVVCYGLTQRSMFEKICGGPFDGDGFRWRAATFGAVTIHLEPQFRAPEPAQYWVELGFEMRRRV